MSALKVLNKARSTPSQQYLKISEAAWNPKRLRMLASPSASTNRQHALYFRT